MTTERDEAERAGLAAAELAQAKADARARGQAARRGDGLARRTGRGERAQAGRTEPGLRQPGGAGLPSPEGGGARSRQDDPQALRAAIDGLLGDQGWRAAAAVGSVFGRWHEIVGREVAAHTRPERYEDGEVVVLADSAVWAAEMRLQAATLVRRLNEELGDRTVTRVTVRGPAGQRQAGAWRVRSGRGPRPTQR